MANKKKLKIELNIFSNMKNLILKSILAGVLISLASIIYLNCSDKIIGSILFSIGLIAVIFLEANLFTGKVGYINSKKSFISQKYVFSLSLKLSTRPATILEYCIASTNPLI